MPPTLYSFIWRHSARDQMLLLALTVATFPLLYATLELPKMIVNDAIDGQDFPRVVLGLGFDQIPFLGLLCGAYLAFVVASGLLKMRLNTQKGVVAERLLRRLRFQLISRTLRFPLPQFRKTSQGEVIAVVTAEAEPLGGLMGDAVAQPVFQGGQMLTILLFLFIQSPWLGLAASALIPVQAYVIPLIQRRVNLLNKERIGRVRGLAEKIGESVAGVEDLRANNGVGYRLAEFTEQLGGLFRVRYRIYQLKFLMKFINNFLNHLTPFFFYLVGGYLAIQGEITVGALVAAIASYKDLASPWKELLAYYNQSVDLSLRYQLIRERFDPPGMIPEELFEGRPESLPRLDGAIAFEGVTLRGDGPRPILDRLSLTIPAGANVAIKAPDATARAALARLLSRAELPSAGRILVGARTEAAASTASADTPHEETLLDMATLHQQVIASRIGVASGQPHFFTGTIAENVQMALRHRPTVADADPMAFADAVNSDEDLAEALASGNSLERPGGDWLNPAVAGFEDDQALRDWWHRLIEAAGSGDYLFERALDVRLSPERQPALAAEVVALRARIEAALRDASLLDAVDRFEPGAFNPSMTVVENLLMAAPRLVEGAAPDPAGLAADPRLWAVLEELDLAERFRARSVDVLDALLDVFSEVDPDHPFLARLSEIDARAFDRLRAARSTIEMRGLDALEAEDRALVLSLPFRVALGSLRRERPEALKRQIIEQRRRASATARARLNALFEPIEPDAYTEALSLIDNLIYGRIAEPGSDRAAQVRDVVKGVLDEAGLRRDVTLLVGDVRTGVGGANLGVIAQERIAFVRAALRRPDVLVLEQALRSHGGPDRARARSQIRTLLPEATILHLEPEFDDPSAFDLVLEIRDGQLVNGAAADETPAPWAASARGDLAEKTRVFAEMPLFAEVDPAQIRLMAYASTWVTAKKGAVVFRSGVAADGAYVLTRGQAELRWPGHKEGERAVTVVEPGRLIGDLSVIASWPRSFDLVATEDLRGLRIGRQELVDLVERDPGVAASLLRTVSGYLLTAAEELRELRGHADPAVRLAARRVTAEDETAVPPDAP